MVLGYLFIVSQPNLRAKLANYIYFFLHHNKKLNFGGKGGPPMFTIAGLISSTNGLGRYWLDQTICHKWPILALPWETEQRSNLSLQHHPVCPWAEVSHPSTNHSQHCLTSAAIRELSSYSADKPLCPTINSSRAKYADSLFNVLFAHIFPSDSLQSSLSTPFLGSSPPPSLNRLRAVSFLWASVLHGGWQTAKQTHRQAIGFSPWSLFQFLDPIYRLSTNQDQPNRSVQFCRNVWRWLR